jgi:hypothetical protein
MEQIAFSRAAMDDDGVLSIGAKKKGTTPCQIGRNGWMIRMWP